jgi:hypothetical protein
MMRKLVNLSRPPNSAQKFTVSQILCTGQASVTGCLGKRSLLFHTYTGSTTENFF